MKKQFKIALGITLGLGVFTAGLFSKDIVTGATSDWKSNAINDASAEIGNAGYNKKEELKASAETDINAKVQEDIGAEVEQQKADLEKLLEQYYQMKISGMENTQAYKDLESQIAAIKQSVYDRYTKEIDQVFASQVN